MARWARDKALEDVEETLCHKGDTLDTEGDSGTITKVVLREAMAPPRQGEGRGGTNSQRNHNICGRTQANKLKHTQVNTHIH